MPPRRLHPTLGDYLAIAISPILIMGLVGSLAYFLLEVFYHGQFQGRLHVIVGLFVMATVLISRISIEEGSERAGMFGLPLAIVTILAINRFVEFRGGAVQHFTWLINFGLISITWCAAHMLTWDCTRPDEEQDDSGEGLMETMGLDSAAQSRLPVPKVSVESTTQSHATGPTWWQRFTGHGRRHAPGTWIVYFSLGALPLFGLGQWLIPDHDVTSRRYAFWLLLVYVGCGLGLLLGSSFLSLRRYLRRRRMEMPPAMARVWVTVGAIIIVVLLIVSAILPRPAPEYSIAELPVVMGSPGDPEASQQAVPHEGVEEDDDAALTRHDEEAAQGEQSTSSPPEDSQPEDGDAADGDAADQGSQSDDAQSDGQSPDEGENRQHEPDDSSQPTGESPDEMRSEEDEHPENGDASSSPPGRSSPTQSSPDENGDKPTRSPSSDSEPAQFEPSPWIPATPAAWSNALKLILYAGMAILAFVLLWRHWDLFKASLSQLWNDLRGFWGRIFGWQRAPRPPGDESASTEVKPLRPFGDYADPFATGAANRMSPEELVNYTFEALEAWGREHGCLRHPDDTPHEWTRQLGRHRHELAQGARSLADLYCQAAFASGTLSSTPPALAELWRQMRIT